MKRARKTKKRRKPAAKRTTLKKSQQRLGKKVNCEYCGEEISLRVRKNAVGPFFHTLCEQAWQSEQTGGPVLAASKNYYDIENDPEWRDLSITTTESAEDAVHNLLIENRNKRHGDKISSPNHYAISYNHNGNPIYSTTDKKKLSEEVKQQDISVLFLRKKLES